MRAERRRVATLVVLTTLALVVALGVHPVSTDRILSGYVLALAAIGLAAGARGAPLRPGLARTPGARNSAGMRAERRRVATLVVLTTLALVVALGVHPVSTDRILAGYVLALAAIGLAAVTRILAADSWRDRSSYFEHTLNRKPAQPTRPSELVRIEREITLGA